MKTLGQIRDKTTSRMNPVTGSAPQKSTPTKPPTNIVRPKPDPQKFMKNPGVTREQGKYRMNRVPPSHTTGPSGRWDEETIHEDGGAVASGMSVGGGSVSPISGAQADPTASAVMSSQNYRKNLFKNLFRRKKPV